MIGLTGAGVLIPLILSQATQEKAGTRGSDRAEPEQRARMPSSVTRHVDAMTFAFAGAH